MKIIWQVGEGNIKTFLDNMPEPKLPYTTLASTLKNLEKKNFISSRLIGNMYLYKPIISEEFYKKNSVRSLVQDYFDNSYKDLVAFFAQQKKISLAELKEIIKMIEEK